MGIIVGNVYNDIRKSKNEEDEILGTLDASITLQEKVNKVLLAIAFK